jgi:hypothetical protein
MHTHSTNKLVTDTLKQIASEEGMPYAKVKKRFTSGKDIQITANF